MVTQQITVVGVFDEKSKLEAIIYKGENGCRNTHVYMTSSADEDQVAMLINSKPEVKDEEHKN